MGTTSTFSGADVLAAVAATGLKADHEYREHDF
jgi:hypothetical protein